MHNTKMAPTATIQDREITVAEQRAADKSKESKVIAVDGPAASGKSTLARNLAQALGYAHLSTGRLYRAVAARALETSSQPDMGPDMGPDMAQLRQAAKHTRLQDCARPGLFQPEIASLASQAAADPEVRATLLPVQRSFAANPGEDYQGAVLDGRDIGSVVCPQAQLKLYLTADLKERAQRRSLELQRGHGGAILRDAVVDDLCARDLRDSARSVAPLIMAADAQILDSTSLSEQETLACALGFWNALDDSPKT